MLYRFRSRDIVACSFEIGCNIFYYIFYYMTPDAASIQMLIVKGSLDEKLPIYEQDPKSKRLDSFEKRFVRD